MLRRRWACRAARRVDEADDQRLATIIAQQERRARRVGEFVIADISPDCLLALLDHLTRVEPCALCIVSSRKSGLRQYASKPKPDRRGQHAARHNQDPIAPSSSTPTMSSVSCRSEARKLAIAAFLVGV